MEDVVIRKRSLRAGIALLLLAQGLAGCGGSGSPAAPLAPSPVAQTPIAQPPAIQFVVFTDPASGFSTSDVRDVDDEFVRFTGGALIWVADGTRITEFFVNGNLIAADHIHSYVFHVRFGTKDGERRAYLTRPDSDLLGAPATILDLHFDAQGLLRWADTTVVVPGS